MVLVTLCATWKRPFCSTKVSTLAPGWDTPWSVNTPWAITTGVAAAEAARDWKCSVPDTADVWALAAVSPVTASDTAATSAPAAPRSLFSLRSITPLDSWPSPWWAWLAHGAAARRAIAHSAPAQDCAQERGTRDQRPGKTFRAGAASSPARPGFKHQAKPLVAL